MNLSICFIVSLLNESVNTFSRFILNIFLICAIISSTGGDTVSFNYGDRIRDARKAAGLTQEQLAQKCGIATITIRQYESGKRQPRLAQFRDIAAATKTPIQKLLAMPDMLNENRIWEIDDLAEQDGKANEDLKEWFDEVEAIFSENEFFSHVDLYRRVQLFVLESLKGFSPEGLLRLADMVNELKKIPAYQLKNEFDKNYRDPDEGEQHS